MSGGISVQMYMKIPPLTSFGRNDKSGVVHKSRTVNQIQSYCRGKTRASNSLICYHSAIYAPCSNHAESMHSHILWQVTPDETPQPFFDIETTKVFGFTDEYVGFQYTSVTFGPFYVQGVQVSNADGCYATFAVESFGSLKRIMKSTATTTA